VKAVETYHKKCDAPYGGICPSQVLFNKSGTLKLLMNYQKIFFNSEEYQKNYYSRKEKANFKYYNIHMKKVIFEGVEDANRFCDLFDVGFLLMQCAIGNIDIIDFSEYKCEHNINKSDENTRSDCCCLFHCVEKHEEQLSTKFKVTTFLNKTNFSEEFINFICVTTSYQNTNIHISKLKFHSLIKNFNENTYKNKSKMQKEKYNITLKEFLKISVDPTAKIDQINSKSHQQKLEKFFESISLVLPVCENYFHEMGIIHSSTIFNRRNDIKELMCEFNIDEETLLKRLRHIYDTSLAPANKNSI